MATLLDGNEGHFFGFLRGRFGAGACTSVATDFFPRLLSKFAGASSVAFDAGFGLLGFVLGGGSNADNDTPRPSESFTSVS